MDSVQVVSVNVGVPRGVDFVTTSLPTTSIAKRPAHGPVRIGFDGVEGNASADTRHHGDEWMRVYAYAVEDYAWWSAQLGQPVGPGLFGEQITTEGVDLNAALVGEIWRVGTALLQIAHVRVPCQTFKGWMGHSGYDASGWVKRFVGAGRPGPYFRVLEEGVVTAGDPITIESRPEHDVSVRDLFRAITTEPDLLTRLRGVPGLKPAVYQRIDAAT